MQIERVAAVAGGIRAVVGDHDGHDALVSVYFETRAPFKIQINTNAVDIGNVEWQVVH